VNWRSACPELGAAATLADAVGLNFRLMRSAFKEFTGKLCLPFEGLWLAGNGGLPAPFGCFASLLSRLMARFLGYLLPVLPFKCVS